MLDEDENKLEEQLSQPLPKDAEILYQKIYHRSKHSFPNLSWHSLTIMSISQLEFNIILISDLLREKLGINDKLENRSNKNFLEISKNYFKDEAGLNFDWGSSDEWRKICGHYKIRNVIVHNSGIVNLSSYSTEIKAFAKKYNEEVISVEDGWLDLSRKYVIEVVQDSQEWLVDLFNAIEKQFPKLKINNWV